MINGFVAQEFDLSGWTKEIQTVAHLAKSNEALKIAVNHLGDSVLLEADLKGNLPLHISISNEIKDNVDYLLKQPNAYGQAIRKNANLETSLHLAAKHMPEETIKLIQLGCDPRSEDANGILQSVFVKMKRSLQFLLNTQKFWIFMMKE